MAANVNDNYYRVRISYGELEELAKNFDGNEKKRKKKNKKSVLPEASIEMAHRQDYYNEAKRPRLSDDMGRPEGRPPHPRRPSESENYFRDGRQQERGPPPEHFEGRRPPPAGEHRRPSWGDPRQEGEPRHHEPYREPRGPPRHGPPGSGYGPPPREPHMGEERFNPRFDPRSPEARMDARLDPHVLDPRAGPRGDLRAGGPRGELAGPRGDLRLDPRGEHRPQQHRGHPPEMPGQFHDIRHVHLNDPRQGPPSPNDPRHFVPNPNDPRQRPHSSPDDPGQRSRVEWGRDSIGVNVDGLMKCLGVLSEDWEIHRDRCDKPQEEFIKHLLGLHKYNCILKSETVSQGTQTEGEDILTSKIQHLTGLDVLNNANLTVPLKLPNLASKERRRNDSISSDKGATSPNSSAPPQQSPSIHTSLPKVAATQQVEGIQATEGDDPSGEMSKPEVTFEAVVLPKLRITTKKHLPNARGIPSSDLYFVDDASLPGAMISADGRICIRKSSSSIKAGEAKRRSLDVSSSAAADSGEQFTGTCVVTDRVSGKVILTIEPSTPRATLLTHAAHIAQMNEGVMILSDVIKESSVQDINQLFSCFRNNLLDIIATESGATLVAILYRYLANDQKRFFIRGLVLKFNKIMIYKPGIQLLLLLVDSIVEQEELLMTTIMSMRKQLCSTAPIIQLTINIYIRMKGKNHQVFEELISQQMSQIVCKADGDTIKTLMNYYVDNNKPLQQLLQNITNNLPALLAFTHALDTIAAILVADQDPNDQIYLIQEVLKWYKKGTFATILTGHSLKQLFEILKDHNRVILEAMAVIRVALLMDETIFSEVVRRGDWTMLQTLFDTSYFDKTAPAFDLLMKQPKCLLKMIISPDGMKLILFLTSRHKHHIITQFMHDMGALVMKMVTDNATIKILRVFLFEAESSKFLDVLMTSLLENLPRLISLPNGNWLLRECINMPYAYSKNLIASAIADLKEKDMKMMICNQYGSMFITEFWVHTCNMPNIRKEIESKLRPYLSFMKDQAFCLELYLALCDKSDFIPHAAKNFSCVAINDSLRTLLYSKIDKATPDEKDMLVQAIVAMNPQSLLGILKSDVWPSNFIVKLLSKVSLDTYAVLQKYLQANVLLINQIPNCSQLVALLNITMAAAAHK